MGGGWPAASLFPPPPPPLMDRSYAPSQTETEEVVLFSFSFRHRDQNNCRSISFSSFGGCPFFFACGETPPGPSCDPSSMGLGCPTRDAAAHACRFGRRTASWGSAGTSSVSMRLLLVVVVVSYGATPPVSLVRVVVDAFLRRRAVDW